MKGADDGVSIKRSDYVEQQVLKNLLTAHERSAELGDAKAVIRLSRYLLHLFNERNEKIVNLCSE